MIQGLYQKSDLQSLLIKRFNKFSSALQNSRKVEVRHLEAIQRSDIRSTYGKNYSQRYQTLSDRYSVPGGEEWKLDLVRELWGIRSGLMSVPGITSEEVETMLNTICTD